MTTSAVFMCGLGFTLLVSVAVVAYLRSSLRKILIELCGTPERAAFWAAFSSVATSVIPVIFAIQAHPDAGSQVPAIFALADELKWGLAGLVLTLTVMAWIIGRFVSRAPVVKPSNRENALAA